MDLQFLVTGQNLIRTDSNNVIGDCKNYVFAAFTFSPEWLTLVKTAQFTKARVTYDMLLVNNRCLIPWEVLVGQGIIKVNVFAGDLITVNACTFTVNPSGLQPGQVPQAATPGIYQQIQDTISAERQQALAAAAYTRAIGEDNFNSEATRVTAEQGRVTAEGNASFGRVKAEADRVIAEGLRVTAESGRAAEVIAARGGYADLDGRLDNHDTQLAQIASPAAAADGHVLTANGLGGTAWEAAGGGGSALVSAYTWTGNAEVVVSAVDVDTNVFTSVGHGLSESDKIYPISNVDANVYPLAVYVGGITARRYYCKYIDADHFSIALTDGGAAVDLTTNATMDLTKWHFEKNNTASGMKITISGLSATKYRAVAKGRYLVVDSMYLRALGTGFTTTSANGWWYGTTYAAMFHSVLGNVSGYQEALFDLGPVPREWVRGRMVYGNTTVANTTVVNDIYAVSNVYINKTITSIEIEVVSYPLANGATLEVYSV